MSDTDDTDDLLLIPPDFFVIDSDSGHSGVEPYYNIVDSLIQKVSNLQERLQSIESSSLNNSLDYWFDNSHNMQQSSGFRKYNSTDDLYIPQSTQGTPQKPHTKFKMNSLPTSPNIDKFSPSKNNRINREIKSATRTSFSPRNKRSVTERGCDILHSNKDDTVINEIDTFLSKVKTIQRINAARNLEQEFHEGDNIKSHKSNKDMNLLLADLNRQRRDELEAEGKENAVKNKEPIIVKEKAWQKGDYKESVPDYGAGVRDILYKEPDKPRENYIKHTTQAEEVNNTIDSWATLDKYPSSDSSSESTQMTAYKKYSKNRNDLLNSPLHTNALSVLSMHKQLLEEEAERTKIKNRTREPKLRSSNTINDSLGLMSLADIWSTHSHLLRSNPSQLLQKLQEEKLRRKHCEELIQELQNRNLELQQKLSVAVKVDDSKNNTIQQFQLALEKIITRLQGLDKEKQELNQEMVNLRTNHSTDMEEASQKIIFHEQEASKALNLAHGNQEKLCSLEKRCTDLQYELESIEKKFNEIQDDYSKETQRNKQLSDILNQKEFELNEHKTLLNDARIEVVHSKRSMDVCQAEFAAIKAECAKLNTNMQEKCDQVQQLTEEKRTLVNEVEARKHHEVELNEELSHIKRQLDSTKVELRNYYQGQVEILVQNKLKEFQSQLDQAEGSFKEEIKKREMSIAKTAATHIQQISEKYTLEIKLLEKKNQEEAKLYQIQVMQYKQQVGALQSRVDHMQEKRTYIAKQLQKIMEVQWNEALKIITSGKSPSFSEDGFNTIDQLNSLKTKSYNNVEEILAQQQEEQHNIARRQKTDTHFSLHNEEIMSSISNNFDKASEETCNIPVDTPVSSRAQGNKQYNENEVQKYINLLLNRPPGNPTQEVQQKESEMVAPENVTERASWQQFDHENDTTKSTAKGLRKEKKGSKPPPWK